MPVCESSTGLNYEHTFTVFTPTYNREKLLHRVFESLKSQTFRSFEWVIVDDGSTDATEELVKEWQQIASFPIRYVRQKNGHKKTAFNHGVQIAQGEFFLCADSDDRFPTEALETFLFHWNQIDFDEREKYLGVYGLCVDEKGSIVGNNFPGDWGIDSNSLEIRHKYKVKGEKWGFGRTAVLREFPFPEAISGHVPEDVVWSAISSKYKTRFINKVVRIYFTNSEDQLTQTIAPSAAAHGNLYWKKTILEQELRWFFYQPISFILNAARWSRFLLHHLFSFMPRKTTIFSQFCVYLLLATTAPLGVFWFILDLFRKNLAKKKTN